MLERKVRIREYDEQTAAVGDRVTYRDGTEGEVVYVGKSQLILEFEESLWVYQKGGWNKLWLMWNCIEVNGFLVPAPGRSSQKTWCISQTRGRWSLTTST